jgi:hypothetical protein
MILTSAKYFLRRHFNSSVHFLSVITGLAVMTVYLMLSPAA